MRFLWLETMPKISVFRPKFYILFHLSIYILLKATKLLLCDIHEECCYMYTCSIFHHHLGHLEANLLLLLQREETYSALFLCKVKPPQYYLSGIKNNWVFVDAYSSSNSIGRKLDFNFPITHFYCSFIITSITI